MGDRNDDLNSHLTKAFKKRDDDAARDQPKTQDVKRSVNTKVEIIPSEGEDAPEEIETDKLGMIRKLQLRNAESAHELQKAKMTYETEIHLLQHKADAAIRESKAFWDAKSVEVAESIKTYVQATVRALEIDRLDSRNADLQRAYESAAVALDRAKSSTIPEVMKDRLIQDILKNFECTLDRIQEDTIVSKYDLN